MATERPGGVDRLGFQFQNSRVWNELSSRKPNYRLRLAARSAALLPTGTKRKAFQRNFMQKAKSQSLLPPSGNEHSNTNHYCALRRELILRIPTLSTGAFGTRLRRPCSKATS